MAAHAPFNKTSIKIGHKTLQNWGVFWSGGGPDTATAFLSVYSLFWSSEQRPTLLCWALWCWGWNSEPPFSPLPAAVRLLHQGALRETGGPEEKERLCSSSQPRFPLSVSLAASLYRHRWVIPVCSFCNIGKSSLISHSETPTSASGAPPLQRVGFQP